MPGAAAKLQPETGERKLRCLASSAGVDCELLPHFSQLRVILVSQAAALV